MDFPDSHGSEDTSYDFTPKEEEEDVRGAPWNTYTMIRT